MQMHSGKGDGEEEDLAPDGATSEEPKGTEEGVSPAGEEESDAQAEEAAAAAAEEAAEAKRGPGPGEDLTDEEIQRQIAALLFASPAPIPETLLRSLLQRPRLPRIKDALTKLGTTLEDAGLPLQVRSLRGGWTLMTSPDSAQVVSRLTKGSGIERISGAALETLSIVAYRQPVTKADVEAVRGVQAGPILRSLVDRGLIRVTGRADVPGNPLEYGTTSEFLDRFGLGSLEELPRDAELARD